MSIPFGHRVVGEFVCMDCITDEDHHGDGVTGRFSAVDERVGSGKECARCGRLMPYLAKVRLLPDGNYSVRAEGGMTAQRNRIVRVERDESVLIGGHALVYVDIGCQREVGISVTPHGKVEVWVHDDPYGDGAEPSARWEYDPTATVDA